MLVSEFAKKYGLPHSLVYENSFATDTRMATPWVTDIPESELAKVVSAALKKRIAYHKGMVEKEESYLKKVEGQL